MGVASELVTRSDSIKLKVSSPEINIRFRNVPDLMLVSEEAEFYLQLDNGTLRGESVGQVRKGKRPGI